MTNYGLPEYDKYRLWIRNARENSRAWNQIMYACRETEEDLNLFLEKQRENNWWNISSEEWITLVQLEKESEEQTLNIDFIEGQAMLHDENEDNAVHVPEDPRSSWKLYRKHLLDSGFKPYVVDNMEKSTIRILKRLSSNTMESSAVKGLVIGNVQSGKTANMAALMAMAADWGWNMFIVLSGTIESLRRQTQTRLLNDLNRPGNLYWNGLEHLSRKTALGQRTQDLRFEEGSNIRYFTVCLKNSSRLNGLIQWLQSDGNKQRQMKILVIDDEADQAGINTADLNSSERRKINGLICNLVNGKDEKGRANNIKYRAMNYIGYTATPYANVLNETGEDSLYPRNFISTLGVSKEYFGPQQIFGVDGDIYDGMNIVRVINNDDLEKVKDIHDGYLYNIPDTLIDSICWFLCGASTMRYWGYKKPISMLVHTSQKQDHHKNISDIIKKWLSNDVEYIIKRCKETWDKETSDFTFEDFRAQYGDYDRRDEEINKYPRFEHIEGEIRRLLGCVSNIPLGEDDEFEYHEGIHLCIDNCRNSGINEDGMYVRLAYPDFGNMPDPAPTFIVVGGATLSRGLTLEGLISTFFLRSVSQADTLMQMGRWFGYRRGYELLPRIWITSKTNDQFKFLSSLDYELRDEIYNMDITGKSPISYGPRIKNTPNLSFIRITAKNRMQSALETDMDFSGSFNQTYKFYDDADILKKNIKVVENFINRLGAPERVNDINRHAKNTLIWRNIDYQKIFGMMKDYKFYERLSFFNNIDSVMDWVSRMTSEGNLTNWNVVVAGKGNSGNSSWDLSYGNVNKVKRTRKASSKDKDYIDIGVLSDPLDLISDVDLEGKDDSFKARVYKFNSKESKSIRNSAGLESTPQLLIYIVDKDSKSSSKSRINLDSPEDIVGLCVNIPGGRIGTSYATRLTIKLDNNLFDDYGDLEETNED